MKNIKIGDKITVTFEATVIETSNAHGTCFKVKLPTKDYTEERIVWIDEDEVDSPLNALKNSVKELESKLKELNSIPLLKRLKK